MVGMIQFDFLHDKYIITAYYKEVFTTMAGSTPHHVRSGRLPVMRLSSGIRREHLRVSIRHSDTWAWQVTRASR